MRRTGIFVIIGLLLSASAAFSNAEEELFDTKTAAAYLEKGLAQLKAKNLSAAIEALEESVSIDPEAEAYYYLGYAYYLKGRSGDAASRKKSIESFDRAYELDPGFSPTRFKPAEIPVPQAGQKKFPPRETVAPDQTPEKTMNEIAQPTPPGAETKQPGQ